ncbi:TolC family protein [Cytophagales bacterium LB-30]|uniref:TolC family protein n=1 Tax=Shiella aurantiaca TaxID=3058365 RepID=A0ABT8F8D5_9BACT|nr:TolC family protein [Shiella aurantiaca]MDN4166753.1 TolC family protein [Shiella aurantiaca]
MNKRFILTAILLASVYFTRAQESVSYSLAQLVQMAQEQSPASKQAITRKENRYWSYRTFKANYMPQLSLNGTLPNYNRSILPITQQDGSQLFREVSQSTASAGLSLSQNIGLTGGQIFVNSQIQRIDNFSPVANSSYSATPASVGFRQPIFAFNSLVWDKRIEPIRYEESLKEYAENMESIARNVSDLYFNLLLAQISYEIAEKNVANNDTLYKIAEGRYNLGKIAENELLQLELSLMNARQSLAQADLDVQTFSQRLRAYIGVKDAQNITLLLPENTPDFSVDETLALSEARKNRSRILAMKREKLEADRDVAQARGDNGLNADLFASFGLTQQATVVPDLYVNPQDQQQIRIGFSVPIVDWGRSRSSIRTAQANRDMVYATLEQEEVNFDQEVFIQVKQFQMLRTQLAVAEKSDEIAQKRYAISKSRYQIGKISITDLNIATQEKDQAKQAYVQALRSFWTAYYNLRLLTLYDFEKGQTISYP